MKPEKRQVQRISLETPMEGLLNKQSVTIIDLSTIGARVEHPTPMPGRKVVDLRFEIGGEMLVVSCELVRSRLQRSARDRGEIVYSSGLRFVDPTQESRSTIRSVVAAMLDLDRRVREPESLPGTLSVAV